MKYIFSIIIILISLGGLAQLPYYDYAPINFSGSMPKGLRDDRAVIIVLTKTIRNNKGIEISSNIQELIDEIHPKIITMGIDPILYVNHRDLVSSNQAIENYVQKFGARGVKNLIFFTEKENGIELIVSPFDSKTLISEEFSSYKTNSEDVELLLKNFGWALKRNDQPFANFVIPESPQMDNGVTIVEKERITRYTGQLRRSKLAVEEFSKINIPKSSSAELKARVEVYNANIDAKNKELEKILKEVYPFEFVLIDEMTHEQLIKNRYQFVFRNVQGTVESIRTQLEYAQLANGEDAKSIVPVMPDSQRIIELPQNAIVTKFYIRQNIVRNIYVGKWDAEPNWQNALKNYINNAIQQFNKVK